MNNVYYFICTKMFLNDICSICSKLKFVNIENLSFQSKSKKGNTAQESNGIDDDIDNCFCIESRIIIQSSNKEKNMAWQTRLLFVGVCHFKLLQNRFDNSIDNLICI